ncbi:MAG: hypothetical protein WC437_05360 [Patescibacteria group bacterium]
MTGLGQEIEWGLFWLTSQGLNIFKEDAEFADRILDLFFGGERVVIEKGRFSSAKEAVEAYKRLPKEEQDRTLVRSVPPKKELVPISPEDVWFM